MKRISRLLRRIDVLSWTWRRRMGTKAAWIFVGLFSLCVTALKDVSRLIGAVESAGKRSFDAGVFTSMRIPPSNVTALRDAMDLWLGTKADDPEFIILRLLRFHIGIDAIFFVPAYCALIWWLLGRVRASERVAWTTAAVTAAADWLETLATWYILVECELAPFGALWALQTLTLIKWLAILWSLGTIGVLWNHQRHPAARARPTLIRTGGVLTSLIAIVVVFAAAVALPAGGPLDQIPDVLRSQFSWSVAWYTRLLATVALALFAASVATGASLAIGPSAMSGPRKLVRNRTMVPLACAVSGGLFFLGCYREHAPRYAALAPALVAAAIWAAAKLATIVGAAKREKEPPTSWGHAIDGAAAARLVGGLAGAVVVAGGIGLFRAAFPALVLGLGAGVFRWGLLTAGAVAIVLAGGIGAQRATLRVLWSPPLQSWRPANVRHRWGVTTAVATLGLAAWLTVDPERAWVVGTTGVVAIAFGTFALAAGFLAWLARERVAWEATQTLGMGVRTPWLALAIATWFVASVLNTEGVYHDARVVAAPRASTPRYANLDSAFASWVRVQEDSACRSTSDDLPLLLVAAPGGGIRAAYWTATVLDALLGGRGPGCVTTPVFAISGVSGGSLGLTTWIAATAAGQTGRTGVSGMADDRALASAAAGLFFRDAMQPFVALATSWRDRAALLEDGWERSTASPLAGLSWETVGDTLAWVPVIVLNGSSVNDGCRVLIANVGGLPAEREHGCSEAPHVGVAAGPVSSAIDAFVGLRNRDAKPATCDTARVKLRAATAALLSARFPLVSPSGALLRCTSVRDSTGPGTKVDVDTIDTKTYVVDGGYYENSGILTLLQLWRSIEPRVREVNAARTNSGRIVPWLVVLDNHYRSSASVAPPRRPLELVAPLKALTNKGVAGQASLEQMAWGEIAGDGAACDTAGSVPRRPSPASGPATIDSARTRLDPSAAKMEIAAVRSTAILLSKAGSPRGCVAVVAPMVAPGVSAPLGWVLSDMSRTSLDSQVVRRLRLDTKPDHRLLALKRLLKRTTESGSTRPRVAQLRRP